MPERKEFRLDWAPHEAEIKDRYLVQDLSLEGLMRYMKERHNFRASKAQYETQLKKWDFRKNMTSKEWDYTILHIRKRKLDGKESDVYFNGSKVPEKKLKKQMSRHFPLTQDQVFDMPIPSTPEAITVETPKTTVDYATSLPNPSPSRSPVLLAPTAALNMDHSSDRLLARQDHPVPPIRPYREDRDTFGQSTWQPQAGADMQAIWETNSVPSPVGGNNIIYNLPCFQFQTLLESTGLFRIRPAQSPVVGTSRRRTPDPQTVNLPSSISKNTHEPLLQRVASPFLSISNKDGHTLLARMFGTTMEADSHSFLSQVRSQMQVSLLERQDGELADKLQSLFAPLDQSSVLQILHFALYRLSNNLLSEDATDKFLEWLIEQEQNELLVSFLKTQMPSVHACATKILESALRIEDADFLAFLVTSGIDISPLKGVYGGRHLVHAASEGNMQIAQILLKNGADINISPSEECPGTALQLATKNGHAEIVQVLLKAGANIDAVTTFDVTDYGGCYSALSHAVCNDDIELVRILVAAGANVNICELQRLPIIKYSALYSSDEVYQILSSGCGEGHFSISSAGICEAAIEGIQVLSNYLAEKGEGFIYPAEEVFQYALYHAVTLEEHQAVSTLLGIGVDPNAEMVICWGGHTTPLSTAVEVCNIESVKTLLQAGADVTAPGVLRAAINKESTEILQFMLEMGADVASNGESFLAAARLGNLEAVQLLLLYGADVNYPTVTPYFTALQLAIHNEKIELVKIFLDAGSNVNASYREEGEQTALQSAVIRMTRSSLRLEVVQMLLAAGADVNAPKKGRIGASILQSAICTGDEELVRVLLKEGADVNSPPQGKEGRTPIQEAAGRGSIPLVKLLYELGADINASPGRSHGRTAIQAASTATHATLELIDFLLDSGADLHAPAGLNGGITALQGAAIRGHTNIALKFLEAGADVNANAAMINGRTALDGAAEHGRLDMVQILLNAGARGDPTKAHRFGRAMKLARKNGHFAIAKLLEQA
ncbi:hypothetical protein MMC31_000984 [Peltigera leucophlebia]|nr:hypothetical protein [Peltigera leucophlebia]